MDRNEKGVALHLVAAVAAAIALAILQAIAGGLVSRGLDVADAEVWTDLGVRRFGVFKLALFLAVVPLVLQVAREGAPARRLLGGLGASAVLAWAASGVLFADRGLAALYLLAGVGATFAAAFEGWRRLAAAGALGFAVAATALASAGESLVEGRTFFTAVIVGVLFCGPLVAAAVALPEAVDRFVGASGR